VLTRLWSSELPYVIVTALVLTALLLRARPGERSTYQNTLWLFLLGMFGLAAAHGAGLLGFDTAARLLEVLFRIVWTIALIRIAGFALFRLVLPKIGKPMPRIVEDLGIIAVYAAYGAARAFVAEDGTRPVPLHIRNAPTRLMKDLGYGKGYRYAHDEPEGVAADMECLPPSHRGRRFYRPTTRGLEAKYEGRRGKTAEKDEEDEEDERREGAAKTRSPDRREP